MDNMSIYTGDFSAWTHLTDEEKAFAEKEYAHLLVRMEAAEVLSDRGWSRTCNGLLLLVGALMAGMPRKRVLAGCLATVLEVVTYDDMDMDGADLARGLIWLYMGDIASLEQLQALATLFGDMTHVAQARVATAEDDRQLSNLHEEAVEMRLHYRLLRAAVLLASCSLDGEAVVGLQMLFSVLVDYRGRDGATEQKVQAQAAEVLRQRVHWSDVHKIMEAHRTKSKDLIAQLDEKEAVVETKSIVYKEGSLQSVQVITFKPHPLVGLGPVKDVDLNEQARVAVFGQEDPAQNGFYHPRHGAWVRTADFPAGMCLLPIAGLGGGLPFFWVESTDTCWLVAAQAKDKHAVVGKDPIMASSYGAMNRAPA